MVIIKLMSLYQYYIKMWDKLFISDIKFCLIFFIIVEMYVKLLLYLVITMVF